MSRPYSNAATNRRHMWRASWTVQDVEQDSVEPALSDGGVCILDSHGLLESGASVASEFQDINRIISNKNAVISLRSDSGQISRHILPYERFLKATVVHIDHKENNLYVRPDIFQEKASILDYRLRSIAFEILEPLGARNVRIGQVYLVFSRTTNSFVRAVCGHMKYTHQNVTRFQMYFVDDGRLEFIEQKDVYLLPFALGAIPPVCVPLDLANCDKSLAFSTCVEHFRCLQYGSRIIFALKSRAQSSGSEITRDNAYNENFPLTFTSKIFAGDTVRFEITCPKNKQMDVSEHSLFSYNTWRDQWSSFSTFPNFARGKTLPCDSTVRVTRRCDREGIYWMIDERTLSFIESQITQPISFLCVDEAIPASYPCIAYVKFGNDVTQSRFCRALTREFSADLRRCTIFLVDYGKFVTCDVFSLFTLEGQPQLIYETPIASFLSIVNNSDANGIVQETRAYLCEGVTYSISLLSVDDDGIFCATVFLPSMESIFNDLKAKDFVEKGCSDVIPLTTVAGVSRDERVLADGLCDDEESFEDDGFMIDVKAALLKLEEKVTRCYDELHRKLDMLQQQRSSEFVEERTASRMHLPFKSTRPKNFLPRQVALPIRVDKAVEVSSTVVDCQPNDIKESCLNNLLGGAREEHPRKIQTVPNRAMKPAFCMDPTTEKGEVKRSLTRKSKGTLATEDFKKIGNDVIRKTEGSCSSLDSGIDHSDEHSSPSPRICSPVVKTVTLKYKPLFGHVVVSSGRQYWVKRSDDDYRCRLWPLFFVHILCEENTRMLDQHLDSLRASARLQLLEMKVGTVCIAYCVKYKAKFRAVITDVKSEVVEVFYVDYGNYEWVKPSNLYTIEKQNYTIRTHPGMAVPCIFLSFDLGNVTVEENCKVKEAFKKEISTENDKFSLRFVAQRADGIYVVEKSDA